jgi:exonuclease SbcC
VQGAEDQWREAKLRKEKADEALLKASLAHQNFTEYHGKIEKVCDQRAALVARNEDLFHVSDVINAGRGTDYGLHIYVLRAMFDTVMALANQRFQSLLNGRFRLVTADDSGDDKRKRLGLGVAVEDALTGKVRSAKSLSGGETFCASLALALGLSDAVRMNAGGIQIDSLFIDEGFGSLDRDQLDEVMSMLNHLSANGRRVGLISHVDSMKESIVERIDVHPARKDQPTSLSVSWMK